MARSELLGFCLTLTYVIAIQVFPVACDSSYPCVGTSPCVKKFILQLWPSDTDYFPSNITAADFATNCTQAQTCLADTTGGGGVISDVTTAGVSFIFRVCSKENQKGFEATLNGCVKNPKVVLVLQAYQLQWLNDRDANLASISAGKQIKQFCSILTTYLTTIEDTVRSICGNSDLDLVMQMIHEYAYLKYGAFCSCVGNCDCKNKNSINPSTVTVGNGSGVGYMMMVFGFMFLIGAILVKTSKRRR